jgi:putative acetyltransferase
MDERSEPIGGSPSGSEASLVGRETSEAGSNASVPSVRCLYGGASLVRPDASPTSVRRIVRRTDSHRTDAGVAPGMRVRPAPPEDALPVFALHVASCRRLGPAGYGPEQVRAWARKDHGPEGYPIGETGHHFVVAERDGAVAGFGDLVTDPADVDAEGEVRAVYVHPDHARRGVGAALLAELEGYARGAGLGSLVLSASLNAVGFYERAGYERVREDGHETGGAELAVVVFRKEL